MELSDPTVDNLGLPISTTHLYLTIETGTKTAKRIYFLYLISIQIFQVHVCKEKEAEAFTSRNPFSAFFVVVVVCVVCGTYLGDGPSLGNSPETRLREQGLLKLQVSNVTKLVVLNQFKVKLMNYDM